MTAEQQVRVALDDFVRRWGPQDPADRFLFMEQLAAVVAAKMRVYVEAAV